MPYGQSRSQKSALAGGPPRHDHWRTGQSIAPAEGPRLGAHNRRHYDRREDAAECERPTRAGKARSGGSAGTSEPSEYRGAAGSTHSAVTEATLRHLNEYAAEANPVRRPELISCPSTRRRYGSAEVLDVEKLFPRAAGSANVHFSDVFLVRRWLRITLRPRRLDGTLKHGSRPASDCRPANS
jgi:hypothetical protein